MIIEWQMKLNQREYGVMDKLVNMMGELDLMIFTEAQGAMTEPADVTEMKEALRHLGMALSCHVSEQMPIEDPFEVKPVEEETK